MFLSYEEMKAKVRSLGPVPMAVAQAADQGVLEGLKLAMAEGLVTPLLTGEAFRIVSLLERLGMPTDLSVIDCPEEEATARAVRLVREGAARILMKGQVNTSDFMRAILDREEGLRTGRLVSQLAVFEIPGFPGLVFHSDGGVNVAPDLEAKRQILLNAVEALNALGIERPKVAVLAANEKVSPKMPATVDAAELVRMSCEEGFPPCIVEGPIAMDVALDPEKARHKGIDSRITGQVDLFLMPNIETGNILGKALVHYLGARMAGIVLGVSAPIVLASRAEPPEGKVNSIVLACLAARLMQ